MSVFLRTIQSRVGGTGFWLAILSAGLLCSSAEAQDNAGRRQQMFDQLLQSLINSQLNQTPQDFTGNPGPAATTNRISPQLTEVRQLSQSFSSEVSRLFNFLNQDMRQQPALFTHFNATIKVNASANVMAQRSAQVFDLASLKPEFVELNKEWSQLAYHLNEAKGLSQNTVTSLKAAENIDQRLQKLFDINPQIDSEKFQRLLEGLEVSLQNLMDEISVELGWSSETRQILLMGRIVEQQVRYMAFNSDMHKNREQAVQEYAKFEQLWGPYASQLWPLKNRYIERGLQRVEQIDREIHQLLWLPIPMDHPQLTRLTDVLKTDYAALMAETSLQEMLKLNNPAQLVKAAQDFSVASTRLSEAVAKKQNLNQLQVSFRPVEQQWKLMTDSFQGCQKPEILRLIKTTDQTMSSLRTSIQIKDTFDREQALQVIASLENYGKHLQEDFSMYVVQSGRYDRAFSYQGLHTCHQFTAFCNNIHQSLADGAKPEDVRDRCEVLARGWNYLNSEFLQKLQGAEREQLNRLSTSITPQIVQLQTMFEF